MLHADVAIDVHDNDLPIRDESEREDEGCIIGKVYIVAERKSYKYVILVAADG